MPPQRTAAEERLIAAYTEAATRINRALKGADPAKRRVLLRQIDTILSQLEELTKGYLQEELPLQYREGSDEAIRELRKLQGFSEHIVESFGTIHTEALQQLADDAALKFAMALEGVRRSARSAITRAQKQQIVNELITSEAEGAAAPSQRVKQILEDSGIVAVQGRTRGWSLEDYASMLTHTVLADAHNTGATNRYLANGLQYGEVIERGTAPDRACQFMRGKVVFLGDRRLVPPFHPNCFGGIKPFLGNPEDPIASPDDPRIPVDVRSMLAKRG